MYLIIFKNCCNEYKTKYTIFNQTINKYSKQKGQNILKKQQINKLQKNVRLNQ